MRSCSFFRPSHHVESDLRTKLDKMAEIATARGTVPILSAGEIPPTDAVLQYATSKGILVTYGGYQTQRTMILDAMELTAIAAK